jgi:hypothetical protein
MDIYSTSFVYPRFLPQSHSPNSSADAAQDLRLAIDSSNHVSQLTSPRDAHVTRGDIPQETLQKTVMDAMQAQQCSITYTQSETGKGWNFHFSGNYLQVMAARGMIMRESSVQVIHRNDCSCPFQS